MRSSMVRNFAMLPLLALATMLGGCSSEAGKDTKAQGGGKGSGGTEVASSSNEPAHGGWWCNEHGVPEEVCARCDTSLVADFKAKKDWCKEHDRPESQCFICHPKLEAKFAAQYEAKYGKAPPKPEEETTEEPNS